MSKAKYPQGEVFGNVVCLRHWVLSENRGKIEDPTWPRQDHGLLTQGACLVRAKVRAPEVFWECMG